MSVNVWERKFEVSTKNSVELISVGSHVLLIIWERNLHGGYNPYGKPISVGVLDILEIHIEIYIFMPSLFRWVLNKIKSV